MWGTYVLADPSPSRVGSACGSEYLFRGSGQPLLQQLKVALLGQVADDHHPYDASSGNVRL